MTNLEDLVFRFRWQLALVLVGLALTAGGVYAFLVPKTSDIQILDSQGEENLSRVTIEVSGAVYKPGVYSLSAGSRVEDALDLSGGLSETADKTWVERHVNRAAVLSDGQKLYIPGDNEQSGNQSDSSAGGDQSASSVIGATDSQMININTANQKELESLPGIGPVYAQKIIDNRPYSTVDELLSKGVIKKSVYENNKDAFSVY